MYLCKNSNTYTLIFIIAHRKLTVCHNSMIDTHCAVLKLLSLQFDNLIYELLHHRDGLYLLFKMHPTNLFGATCNKVDVCKFGV